MARALRPAAVRGFGTVNAEEKGVLGLRSHRPSDTCRWVEQRPKCRGFTLAELIVVLVLLALVGVGIASVTREIFERKHCKRNLYAIYNALELYEIDRGTLPRMAFFPDQPRMDRDSPVVLLRPYCSDPDIFVCPAAPRRFQELGLTYLWNVGLNGKKLHSIQPPVWLMTELQALSDQVPAPHLGIYNVLFSDGRVLKMKVPPAGLREM